MLNLIAPRARVRALLRAIIADRTIAARDQMTSSWTTQLRP